MDLETKKDLTSNWFKMIQESICHSISDLENNNINFEDLDNEDEWPTFSKLKKKWAKTRENAHSDYIIDEIRTYDKELDIVVEAKAKELAIFKYRDIYVYNKNKKGVLV